MSESSSSGSPLQGMPLGDDELAVLDRLVSSLVEVRKGVAAFQAMETALLNAAYALGVEHADGSQPDGGLGVREVAAEIGAAWRVSDRTVQRQLAHANHVAEGFPSTLDALATGRISRAHVAVIVEAGDHLIDPEIRAEYERVVLEVAERESSSRLRSFARLVAQKLHPRSMDERHRAAVAERGVWVSDLEDGMSQLTLVAASMLVHGIHDRVTKIATAVHDDEKKQAREARADETGTGGGDVGGCADRAADVEGTDSPAASDAALRSVEQLRADILCDLALTGDPSGHDTAHTGVELHAAIRAEVHVTVPVLTLIGASTEPAMLDGVQPVDTATALQLAGAATGWDRVLTHPVTGAVLAVDRYRPSAELRRFLRAVDQRCRFPGCMVPARRCDLDHEHDAAHGGSTDEENLTDKCRRHHVLKHHTRWKSEKQRDGTIVWTSPTGRKYPDRAIPRVVFTPLTDPAPF